MNLKINSDWVKMKVEYGWKPQSQCGECTQTCKIGEPCAVTVGRPQADLNSVSKLPNNREKTMEKENA